MLESFICATLFPLTSVPVYYTVAVPCGAPLFSCLNSRRCTLMEWVLDGRDDCLDGSDEGPTFTAMIL